MYCNHCGKPTPEGSRFCSECGTQLGKAKPNPSAPTAATPTSGSTQVDSTLGTRDQHRSGELIYPRNPPLSPHVCWANIFLVGLAQIIHGQIAKGFSILGGTIVVGLIYYPAALLIASAAILDAFLVGWKLKKGKPVGKWHFFPI